MNDPASQDTLFSRVCDGLAATEEITTLHGLLRTDQETLDAWLLYSSLHGELAGGADLAGGGLKVMSPSTPDARGLRMRRQWHPLTAAAAGLLFGMFFTTMVWAYVGPVLGKIIPLLEESFESSAPTLATRVPLEPGIWRGDKAEIVTEEQGMTPLNGQRMLRFLRADHDGKPRPSGGHIADVYRLIDIRPMNEQFADGGAVVEATAKVNAIPFPEEEKYGCAISIYALDAETVPGQVEMIGSALEASFNAMARSSRTKLDRIPSRWQTLTTELRLPPGTEFLVIRLHISQAFDSETNLTFTGSYADDIRVSLKRRSPLP